MEDYMTMLTSPHASLTDTNVEHDEKVINIFGENIDVQSSWIKNISYHPAAKFLQIDMPAGNYVYFNVPKDLFLSLMVAESKGMFFNENIKGKFRYKQTE
jgi:hypothetical protein